MSLIPSANSLSGHTADTWKTDGLREAVDSSPTDPARRPCLKRRSHQYLSIYPCGVNTPATNFSRALLSRPRHPTSTDRLGPR